MAGKLHEGNVLFAPVVQNSNGGMPLAGETNDQSTRPSQLPLQRLHSRNRRVEMFFEEFFENVDCIHIVRGGHAITPDNIEETTLKGQGKLGVWAGGTT